MFRPLFSIVNSQHHLPSSILLFTAFTISTCNPGPNNPPGGLYQFSQQWGTLYSPNFPSNYGHRFKCVWYIGGADTQRIKLTFNTLRMEPKKDFLEIGLGPIAGEHIVAVYDVDDQVSPLTTEQNPLIVVTEKLWLFMFTDFSILNQGFNISYELGKYQCDPQQRKRCRWRQ